MTQTRRNLYMFRAQSHLNMVPGRIISLPFASCKVLLVIVTKPRHKGGRSLTNKNTKHKQTRENTQQLNISLQIFITTTTLLINLHEYNN